MGGKKATTTSSVSIPPEVLARYNAVNTRAETAATTPYEAFGKTASDYVAPLNARQNAGFNDINATAGSYQPYLDAAGNATTSGMGPAYEGIDNYMSPYIKNVADTTGAYLRQQQEQAQSGALGNAISSGAFGGDRAGIAAANLQQQNQMAYGKTMADILNQGYTQALGASQADLARQLQGGSQLAGLGAQSQQLGLQGAQAKIAAGTMEQQTEQAGKDAMINQFMQEKGYPFQVAQFLANIATGTGAAAGSTTTTQTPRNWLGFASGGAVEGYADGGGVAGPRTYTQSGIGGAGYVPAADLPVGQLMIADPPEQSQGKGTEEIIKLITMAMGAARGGAIDQRHGYATDGSVQPYEGYTELLRSRMRDREKLFAERPSLRDTTQGTTNSLNLGYLMRQPTNPANMGMGATSSFTSTPNHPYPTYPNAPTTGVTPPNEKFDPQVMADYNAAQLQRPTTGVAAPTTGSYSYPAQGTEELRRSMGARNGLEEGRRIIDGLNQDALKRAPTNPANMGLAGRPAPQMVAPTGVAPVSALEELNFSDPYNVAGTAAAVSGGVATPVVDAAPAPVPTPKAEPKSYFIDGQTWIRHPNGLVTDFLENPIDVNAARGILYQMDLQDRAEMNKSLAQSYDSLSQVHRDKLALSQRNKDALLGMYQGNFPVSAKATGMAASIAPTGVSPPATLPNGVPPAAAPSRLPPNEPTAAIGVSGAAVPVVASTMGGLDAGVAVPPVVDKNGVAGPAVAAPAVVQQPDDQAFADPFGYAVGFTLQSEGGFNPQDANGAPVNFGINQAYHPEVDVSKITQDQAREIYRRDYWEPINGDALAAKDPQLARAVFDTAVMSGVGTANDLLEKSGGDTQRFLQLRADYLSNLITKNPEKYGKYAKAWNNRTLGLGGPNMMTGFGETGIGAPDQGGVAGGLFNNGKPYEDRNMIGKFFYDPATGKLNPNAVMALLGGLARGAEAQTISPLGGILAGLGGGMETYKGLLKQQADIGLTQAQTGETQVRTTTSRFVVGPDGMPMVIMPDNSRVDFYTFRDSPELQAQLGSAETAAIVKAAEDANVAKAASAPDAGIYNTQEVQNAYNTEEATLRSLQGDRTASNTIVTNIGNAAAAAGGNTRANTFMQLNAFAELNGNPAATQAGYAASARAAAVQAVNFASSILGMEPISNMSESAAIIAKSKSILASTAAQQLDAETATALNVIMTSLPDIEQDPRASAKLMASVVQAQQRAIDLKNFTDGYISRENGNRTLTAFDAEKVFNDKTAQLYEQEKPYLEALILTGGDPSKVDPTSGMTPMQLLTSGQLSPQETADVLSQLFPQGYPSHLVTTFSR
jgi:hypothetical protein